MSQKLRSTARFLAASISVLLACAGLGAFSGCNLSMVQAAREGVPGGAWMIFVGISLGLLIGVVISLWNRSEAQQPAFIWRRFALRLSYASVCLLVAFLSLRAEKSVHDMNVSE